MAGTKKVALVAAVESGSSRNHYLSASATAAVFFFYSLVRFQRRVQSEHKLYFLFFLYLQWLHKKPSLQCLKLSTLHFPLKVDPFFPCAEPVFFFLRSFFSPLVCHLLPRCFLSAWKMRRSAPDHTEHKTLLAPLSDGKQLGLDMDNCEREKSSQLLFFYKLL